MAVSAGDAYLDIHSRLAAGFGRQLASQVQAPVTRAGEQASHHFGRSFARGLKTAGVAIGVGLAAATALATRGVLATTKAASDLNETVNKTNVIFGGSAPTIQRWAQGSAKAMGLSRNEALTNAAAFGDMFQQLKIGQPQAVNMSTSMVKLAGDLASFSNADITQVLEAQQSAFRGEYDALQRFIPNINAARVEQEALRQTHKASAKDLTAAEKAQATYSIMLKDSTRAQGDFARTSGGLANQQRIAKAQWEDLKTTIGQGFLPAQLAVTQAFTTKVLPALKVLAENYGPKAGAVISRLARSFADSIPSAKQLGLGVSALGAAFSGEGITTSSDKFVGKMERVGDTARKVVGVGHELRLALHLVAAGFREGDVTSSGWHGTMEKVGLTARRFVDSFRQAGPQLHAAGGGGRAFANTLTVVGPILDVVARNMHNMLPWLPAIVAGFLAFRAVRSVIGPLSDLGTAIRNFATPVLIVATFAQARAQKALAAAMREQAASSLAAAGAQNAANTAGKVGILTALRMRVATIAQAVAQRVVVVATRAWAAAQWLVNAALTANPIGIVVVAVAALAAGIIYAYKHSETFRRIVQTAFRGAQVAIAAVWNWVRQHWPLLLGILTGPIGAAVVLIIRNWDRIKTSLAAVSLFILRNARSWFDTISGVALGILRVMGRLPGPMGAPFRAAERAVIDATNTVHRQLDRWQAQINKLHGKTVKIGVDWEHPHAGLAGLSVKIIGGPQAQGGLIRGRGGPRDDKAGLFALSDREFVEPAAAVDYYGVPFMEAIRKRQLPRMADGGFVGTLRYFERQRTTGMDTLARKLGTGWARAYRSLLGAMGGAGAPFGPASGNVVRLAMAQARRMGASHKVALALIEAGIVESGLRNLPYGDRDSLGFLQQRPSQGWAHPMNISYAAWDFLRRAIPIQGRYRTAGQLAQAVQRSAFPARYDQHAAEAERIIGAYGFAGGGLVTRPTLAMLGERGPEAVIPLDRAAASIDYDRLAAALVRALSGVRVQLDGRQVGELITPHLRLPLKTALRGRGANALANQL